MAEKSEFDLERKLIASIFNTIVEHYDLKDFKMSCYGVSGLMGDIKTKNDKIAEIDIAVSLENGLIGIGRRIETTYGYESNKDIMTNINDPDMFNKIFKTLDEFFDHKKTV